MKLQATIPLYFRNATFSKSWKLEACFSIACDKLKHMTLSTLIAPLPVFTKPLCSAAPSPTFKICTNSLIMLQSS